LENYKKDTKDAQEVYNYLKEKFGFNYDGVYSFDIVFNTDDKFLELVTGNKPKEMKYTDSIIFKEYDKLKKLIND